MQFFFRGLDLTFIYRKSHRADEKPFIVCRGKPRPATHWCHAAARHLIWRTCRTTKLSQYREFSKSKQKFLNAHHSEVNDYHVIVGDMFDTLHRAYAEALVAYAGSDT